MPNDDTRSKTAFVFAGGGSFGAIQVGMLRSLASRGIAADMVVGSSVGALNGAYYADNPTIEGIRAAGDDLARIAPERRVSADVEDDDEVPISAGFSHHVGWATPTRRSESHLPQSGGCKDPGAYRRDRYSVGRYRGAVGRFGCASHHRERCGTRQLSRRCISTISILPMELYRATRRSRSRSHVVRGA